MSPIPKIALVLLLVSMFPPKLLYTYRIGLSSINLWVWPRARECVEREIAKIAHRARHHTRLPLFFFGNPDLAQPGFAQHRQSV
jgi:hypothetical protein